MLFGKYIGQISTRQPVPDSISQNPPQLTSSGSPSFYHIHLFPIAAPVNSDITDPYFVNSCSNVLILCLIPGCWISDFARAVLFPDHMTSSCLLNKPQYHRNICTFLPSFWIKALSCLHLCLFLCMTKCLCLFLFASKRRHSAVHRDMHLQPVAAMRIQKKPNEETEICEANITLLPIESHKNLLTRSFPYVKHASAFCTNSSHGSEVEVPLVELRHLLRVIMLLSVFSEYTVLNI